MSKKLVFGFAVILIGIIISVIAITMLSDDLPDEDELLNIIENDDGSKVKVIEEVAFEEVLAQKAIELLYSIPDVNEFEYYMDVNAEYNDNGEINKEISKGFSEICTDDGLMQIVGNRLFLTYMEAAYYGQFTITVKNIDLELDFEKEGDGSILHPYDKVGYEYEVELLLEYIGGETKTIFEDGQIHLGMIDGEWKVDQLSSRLIDDIFMAHLRGE